MKTITYNDDNLTIDNIDDFITKARAILINDQGKMYLSQFAGMYLFPGGRIEDNENIEECLTREIREETGIELSLSDIKPFLLIRQFIKNYPKRGTNNDFINRLNETYYYLIYTNKNVKPDKMNLMENEIENNFNTIQIELNEIDYLLEQNKVDNIKNKYFAREVKTIADELKKYHK
jgi:hypothetical protein